MAKKTELFHSDGQNQNGGRKYPFLPAGRKFKYVGPDNQFMQAAWAEAHQSTCLKQQTGAVIVKNKEIVAAGSNTGEVVVKVCPRVENNCQTGTGYKYCTNVCRQGGHAEAMAVLDARNKGIDVSNADLYLAGHWWCCEPCWNDMVKAGIQDVYLEEDSASV